MELNQNDIELLDRYFSGQLKGEELDKLQERLKDAEFAREVQAYVQATNVIRDAGRNQLRSTFSTIQSDLENTNEIRKYSPSPRGGTGFGGLMITGIIVGLLAIGYYFFSDKVTMQKIESAFPNETTIDTVYHYRVKRDTIIVRGNDTVAIKKADHSQSDTVYVRVKKESIQMK